VVERSKGFCLEKDNGLPCPVAPKTELPKIEDGGGPAGVKDAVEEGGGPAGVVDGLEAPKANPLLPFCGVRSGVEGGLDEGLKE